MTGQDHIPTEPVNARIFPIPPVVAGLFIGAGYALNLFVPLTDTANPVPLESKMAGALIIACAIAVGFLAAAGMRRVKTTHRPGGRASALAFSGVYKRTRNPMYLALVLITLGLGIAAANPWMILMAPLLLLYLQERVVRREEAYLAARFGSEYEAYRKRVRRWF